MNNSWVLKPGPSIYLSTEKRKTLINNLLCHLKCQRESHKLGMFQKMTHYTLHFTEYKPLICAFVTYY
uniref:Uncharacterized protein n=1 Tax=Anguilla anguilla TaxID=7936 RepID=A0A0E9R6R4_ANGAN